MTKAGHPARGDFSVLDTPLRQVSDPVLGRCERAGGSVVRREGTLFAPEPGDQLFAE